MFDVGIGNNSCVSTDTNHFWNTWCRCVIIINANNTWWRHQMETFSASLALCARNSPVTGELPAQRPVMRSFGVFFDLHLNKRLSKTITRLVIWDAIALIMTTLYWHFVIWTNMLKVNTVLCWWFLIGRYMVHGMYFNEACGLCALLKRTQLQD